MNSQKQIISILKITTAALVLLFGIDFAGAQYFVSPGGAPPTNNTDIPIHVGPAPQAKIGGLGVKEFDAYYYAGFKKQAIFQKFISGNPAGAGTTTLLIGGSAPSGGKEVHVDVEGSASVTASLYSDSVKSGSGERNLCADGAGNIVFCP